MKHLRLIIPTVLMLTCCGCSQSTTETAITDGAEAATVAAVVVLDSTLPVAAPMIINGLNKVSATAVSMLQFPDDMFTLEQLINLDMASGDPNITKYRAIVNFVLPVLNRIPGISTAMNTPLNALSSNVLHDVKAFFEGIQLGLGQPVGITMDEFLQSHPHVRKTLARGGKNGLSVSDFDVIALINALKSEPLPAPATEKPTSKQSLQVQPKAEIVHVSAPVFACKNGHCHRAVVVDNTPKVSTCWRIVGTDDYMATDGTIIHGE